MIKTDQPSAHAALQSLTDALPPERDEGVAVATKLLTVLKSGLSQDGKVSAFAEALGDLIDIDIGWNNLNPTQERLKEFSRVMVAAMEADVSARIMGNLLITPELREGQYITRDQMALKSPKLKDKPVKGHQAHLLSTSFIAMLQGAVS